MKSPSKVTAKSPAAEAVTPKQVPAYQSLILTAVACKKEHAQLHSAKITTASKTPTNMDVSELKESTAAIATPQSQPSNVTSPAVTSVEPQHKPARHSPAMAFDLSKQHPLQRGIGMASMTADKVHVHLESSAKRIASQDDAATGSCAKAKPFQAESALSTHATIPSTSRVPPAKPPGADQQPSPSQLVDSSDFLPQLSSDSSSSSGSSETSSSTSSESSSSSDSSSSDEL
ncbi:hypothetical protein AAVH_01386 [Aphelenchoides avenae]|nr:hypothetical protein AAVH_01386 [Aphelenchus avenae]